MSKIKEVKKCRVCRSARLYRFLDLGSMPIPNGFLKKEELENPEAYFELACLFCENCGLVQLTNVVNPEIMFKNYVYIPSTAKIMMNNFSNLAYSAYKTGGLDEKSLIVDIGANDGSLLTFFKSYGCKVVGIDPAENLAQLARMNGVTPVVKLFNSGTAKYVLKKYGKTDVITATNVIAHIDNSHEVFKGVSILLKPNGVFITEFPYLLDLITKNQFDTIYHEHLSYFSLKPWKTLVEKHGFEIVDAQRLHVHGGSIRLTHQRKSEKTRESKAVEYLIGLEEHYGLYDKGAYERFAHRILDLREELIEVLKKLKKQKKRIIGYGAAAKGNVLTNFFGIGTEILDYIVDSTPYKQGLYTPGKHIPVYAEQKLLQDMPDYALILAWNFADEIMKKQAEYSKRGGKFIIPVPKVRII